MAAVKRDNVIRNRRLSEKVPMVRIELLRASVPLTSEETDGRPDGPFVDATVGAVLTVGDVEVLGAEVI